MTPDVVTRTLHLRNAAGLLLAMAAGCAPIRPLDESTGRGEPYVPYSRTEVVGHSVEGRPIEMVSVGRGVETMLVMAAFHGDEWQSAYVARRLTDYLIATAAVPVGRTVQLVPAVNPDGLEARRRTNARRVDINRNFPAGNWLLARAGGTMLHGAAPGSEPETQVVIDLLQQYRPRLIVSIHTMRRGRHCVNYDGPARELAQIMSRACGFPPRDDIGYDTPGSFGTYAGIERQIPTITLELPRASTAEECWDSARGALLAAVRFAPARP